MSRATERNTRRRPASAPKPSALVGALLLAVAAIILGGLAADPIYQSERLWLVLGVAGAVTFAIVVAGARWRWGSLTIAAILLAFVLLVVPLAVPDSLGAGLGGLVRGLGDGLAAVALGWKQLLTLTLPVGSYQTVLVPALVTIMASVGASTALALRGGRLAPLAALPLLLPVLFGTIFGSSSVSSPVRIGAVTVVAPRELALWLCAFALGAAWVAWAAGAKRRAALRLGRDPSAPAGSARRGVVVRAGLASATVAVALVGGLAVAPAIGGDARTVPRDRIDPELVVREQTSPLASYRSWKRDAAFDAPTIAVESDGKLPHRLRFAVLDTYDGVDFSVGAGASGRFTRFPSGERLAESSRVRVSVEAGYRGIWVPLASPIGGPPAFAGQRSGELAESFYLNRETGGAVAVPTAAGLREGDGYAAHMNLATDAKLSDDPASDEPLVDLETMPELARWLEMQQLPANGEGVQTAIERLRERGYLSHSLTDGEGERDWITALSDEYGTRFVTSPGGHSIARLEILFAQLSDQQRAAGEQATESMLVAGIGDDEQFAAAAALVARAMGFDSRVVLGMRLGGDTDGVPGIPACAAECTGQNMSAWVEVSGADGVWAPLDVTPQVATPPTTLEEGEQLPEYPTTPETRDASESDPPVGMSESDSAESDDNPENSLSALWPVLRVIGLSLGALALLALLLLFIPFVKRLRTKRRREAVVPEVWALGAWDELLDSYADAGVPVPRGGSRRDIAEQLAIPGGEWIAWNVDRAVFSRESIRTEDAEQLWQVVDARIGERRAEMSAWARFRAAHSLASFGLPTVAELRRSWTKWRGDSAARQSGTAARGES